MKTKKQPILSSLCALALLAQGSSGALAQDKPENKSERNVIVQRDGVTTFSFRTQEPLPERFGIAAPLPGQGATAVFTSGGQEGNIFQFVSSEMSFDVRQIKGAPFSADTYSESVQTLADGNRIVQKQEGHVYRDSQGRTRSERSFGASHNQMKTIHIFDQVAGTSYILEPNTRTARQTSGLRVYSPAVAAVGVGPSFSRTIVTEPTAVAVAGAPKQIKVSGGVLQGSATKRVQPNYPPIAKAAQAQGAVNVQISINEAGEVTDAQVVSGHPLLRDAAIEAARQWTFKPTELEGKAVKVQGVLTFNFTLAANKEENAAPVMAARVPYPGVGFESKSESLGKQMIEGVECDGTRTITTIPAGTFGNERAIETIREQWFSPELKMMVLSKTTDPRFGESTYRLTNINRSEPDATLFQVPADYTVKEGGYNYGFSTDAIKFREAVLELEGKVRKLREGVELEKKVRKPNDQ